MNLYLQYTGYVACVGEIIYPIRLKNIQLYLYVVPMIWSDGTLWE